MPIHMENESTKKHVLKEFDPKNQLNLKMTQHASKNSSLFELHALRVGLVAAREVALVGPLVGVQHPVLGQRLLARQRLTANVADLK